MRKVAALILIFALLGNSPANATQTSILEITKLDLTATTIKVTYRIESYCPIGEPKLQLLNKDNVLISKSYPPKSLDEPLVAMLVLETETNCTKKIENQFATLSFGNDFSVTNVSAFKFPVTISPIDEKESITISTREIRFVGITQESNFGGGEVPNFQLEEFWFQPGKQLIRTVLGNKNINTILGTTKEGIIVKTFKGERTIQTWLVTPNKWELLSNKTIFIEPGTISKDKKWLLGRKVADGPSTRFYAQNLATGAISILFDVSKNGGGYICGGMSDTSQKYVYFSHVTSSRAVVYRVDSASRKVKLIGKAQQGFCLSDVMEDGRLVGLIRNSNNENVRIVLADPNNPDTAMSQKTPQFPSIGNANSQAFASGNLMVLSDLINNKLYLADYRSTELWEGPIDIGIPVQFFNPLPGSWYKTTSRPIQP